MGNGGENRGPRPDALVIERSTPRVVFAEMIAQALGGTRVDPSPMAVAYLIDLLTSQVCGPGAAPGSAEAENGEWTLTEALFAARSAEGTLRIERLRHLGDRALFVSGFFGGSLYRKVVDLDFYRDMGRIAYSDLALLLERRVSERTWTDLYGELADRFADFMDILAEVSDSALGSRPDNLLRLYERYLLTRNARDRARLLRLGCALPPEGPSRHGSRFCQ